MEREYLPTPGFLSLPQIPSQLTLRAEALPSRPHYRHSPFVLRVRESWDCCRKTTGSKNDLHGVEQPFLLPLLPLSSSIIRVIVRNVPVWESYITHLSHDRLRAASYFRLDK